MLRNKKIIIIALLLMLTVAAKAQSDKLAKAIQFLQNNNLDSAKIFIDAATKHPFTKNNAQAWYIKGFIYKEIYNKNEIGNKQSTARTEALQAFKKSIRLDTLKENITENTKNITYLAYKFFNDAANSLDTLNYKIAIEDFEQYKTIMTTIDTTNIAQKELEFNLAIASVYTRLFEKDRDKNTVFFNLAKASYLKVLKTSPNNATANYNIGILFYNQAVYLIKKMDYDVDMIALSDIQDNSIILFKQALPFMNQAYTLNPTRKEAIQGLSGIYFSLNDFEKSTYFQKLLESLNTK